MTTGERLKAAREARGLTQRELASAAGVSPGYVALVEGGQRKRPSGDILLRLARALGTTMEALLDAAPSTDQDEPPPFDLLRATGASQSELDRLARRWPVWGPKRRRAYLKLLAALIDETPAGDDDQEDVSPDPPQAKQRRVG